jgi:hypothetical protein
MFLSLAGLLMNVVMASGAEGNTYFRRNHPRARCGNGDGEFAIGLHDRNFGTSSYRDLRLGDKVVRRLRSSLTLVGFGKIVFMQFLSGFGSAQFSRVREGTRLIDAPKLKKHPNPSPPN